MGYKHVYLICLCIVFLLAGSVFSLAAEIPKVGVVGRVQGKVTAILADKNTVTLKAGDAIYLNESIHTGKDAFAQLMFLDRSALTIISDTDITVDAFVYNPANSIGEMSLRNTRGALRFIGGALSKQDYVNIKTPVSTVGIRGGIVQVDVAEHSSETTAIFLYGHDMTVHNVSGAVQSVMAFGQGILVRNNGYIEPVSAEAVNTSIHRFNSAILPRSAANSSTFYNVPAYTGNTTLPTFGDINIDQSTGAITGNNTTVYRGSTLVQTQGVQGQIITTGGGVIGGGGIGGGGIGGGGGGTSAGGCPTPPCFEHKAQ